MSTHRIDQLFRERLADGVMTVPEQVWDSIEPYLPDSRKRDRGGLIWLFGSGLLLAGVVTMIVLYAHRATSAPAAHEELSPVQTIADNGLNEVPAAVTAAVRKQTIEGVSNFSEQNSRTGNASLSSVPSRTAAGVIAMNKTLPAKALPVERPVQSDPITFFVTTPEMTSGLEPDFSHAFVMLPRLTTTMGMLSTQRALPDPAKDCYRFGGRRSQGTGVWFVEAYAGPVLASRKLTSRAEDVSEYIARRDSTESSHLSWNAGVRVGYLHHSGISVRIGAHYTQVEELFNYVTSSFGQTSTRYDTFYDGSGAIIDIDTVTIVETGKRVKETHNRYHTVDIPLLVGYQVSRGDWSYGVHAGPVFNVAFIKKGDILSPAGTPVSISDHGSTPPYLAFRNKLGMSIYAAGYIGHRIGYRTMLYAEPYLLARLASITLNSYPIDQRQTTVGLSVGIRVALN